MKTVKRNTVEALANLFREHKVAGGSAVFDKAIDLAHKFSKELYGTDRYWCAALDLIGACCGHMGLADLTDDEICEVLKILKIDVTN